MTPVIITPEQALVVPQWSEDVRPSRWSRDPGIVELIQYLDQRKFQVETPRGLVGSLDTLSNKDWELVCKEASRCQRDFIYAAKNYFWITNKKTGDQLFSLWEHQEWIYEKIMAVRALGIAQKFIILKARQLGISTLCEALIAWGTIFYPNINASVVGPDKPRAEYLFAIMAHIYDQLPWWLRPMCSNRTFDGGLVFDNPDPDRRRLQRGLGSRIEVQTAGRLTGVGQGLRLNLAHISELSSFQDDVAREMIQADLGNALAESSPMTMAIIESTAQGAGRYYHELYRGNKDAGEDAAWNVIFIPAFMEKTRVLAPRQGWKPEKVEVAYRDQVKATWLQCDNKDCERWHESWVSDQSWVKETCPECKIGKLLPYILSDPQLRFMEYKRKDAERTGFESVKKFRQELSVTETECFQLSGDPVFPEDCLAFASRCVRNPIMEGHLDKGGQFHGVVKKKRNAAGQEIGSQCFQEWCDVNHDFDERNIQIWETPIEGAQYIMGVDVAEGLGGKHDFSVIVINRIGVGLNADVQVAQFRSNTINHYDLGIPVVQLGRWYNWAMAAIEYNNYTTCGDAVRITYNYPNLYRWKHLDADNIGSHKWHWYTKGDSKPKLWGNAVKILRAESWYPKSGILVEEMKTFQKDEESDRKAEAERGFKDDCLMAAMIAVYCAHETDHDERILNGVLRGRTSETEHKEFACTCLRCGDQFESERLPDARTVKCPKCGSIMLKARRHGVKQVLQATIKEDALGPDDVDRDRSTDYDSM